MLMVFIFPNTMNIVRWLFSLMLMEGFLDILSYASMHYII